MEGMVKEVKLFLFILFLLAGSIIAVYLVSIVYTPNINAILVKAKEISFLPLSDFAPEPLEKTQSITFFISLPLLAILYFVFLSKKFDLLVEKHKSLQKLIPASTMIIFTGIAIYTFSRPYDIFGMVNYLHLYFLHNIDYTYYFSFYILFFFVIFSSVSPNIQMLLSSISRFFLVFFGIFIFFLYYYENYPYPNSLHFNALFFSQYQVSVSKLALCTKNFKNTYGLYPHFLSWIFDIVPLTVQSFKITFIVLLEFSYIFLYLFLTKNLKNNYLVFLAVLSYIYYTGLYRFASGKDMYFQYFPLRTLFPFIIMYVVSIYDETKGLKLFITINILIALSILWNPDSGIMIMAIWIAYLVYINYVTFQIVSSIRKTILAVLSSFFIIFFILLLYGLIILEKYHSPFIWDDLFITIKMFSSLGYYMISLPESHPYLVYLGLIVLSFGFLFYFIDNKKNTGLFLWTLWMAASFMYFQGRSHPYTFSSIIINMFILLPLLYQAFNTMKLSESIFIQEIKYVFIGLSAFFISSAVLFIYDYMTQEYYKIIIRPSAPLQTRVNFIKDKVSKNEKILILDPSSEGILYLATQTFPFYQNGQIDLFLRTDHNKLLSIIETGKVKKIFIPKKYLKNYSTVLKKRYTIQNDSKTYFLYFKVKSEK